MPVLSSTVTDVGVTKHKVITIKRSLTVQQTPASTGVYNKINSKRFNNRVHTLDGDLGVLPTILTKNMNCLSISPVPSLEGTNMCKNMKPTTTNKNDNEGKDDSPCGSLDDDRPITPFLDTSTPTSFPLENTQRTSALAVNAQHNQRTISSEKHHVLSPTPAVRTGRQIRIHKDLKTVISYINRKMPQRAGLAQQEHTPATRSTENGTSSKFSYNTIKAGLSKKMKVPPLHPNIRRPKS